MSLGVFLRFLVGKKTDDFSLRRCAVEHLFFVVVGDAGRRKKKYTKMILKTCSRKYKIVTLEERCKG